MIRQSDIFAITGEQQFEELALNTFRFQASNCNVYKEYLHLVKANPEEIQNVNDIPFLPISFFKHHDIKSSPDSPEAVFISSGTTNQGNSRHLVASTGLYKESLRKGFSHFYGSPDDWVICALTPKPAEKPHSSLVYMLNDLIKIGENPQSGFYQNDFGKLSALLQKARGTEQKVLICGLTYLILDFFNAFQFSLTDNIIIMETGGMKGTREEMNRSDLHEFLSLKSGLSQIHSEYGMTECLSQAYSQGQGIFQSPPWMKIMIRDIQDPRAYLPSGKTGGINIIDLANLNSCSFIETEDLGTADAGGSFTVNGRSGSAPVRGCNLMTS